MIAARLRLAATLLILFASSACSVTMPPMPAPESLAGTEAWRVQMHHRGSRERYAFGPYQVANVRRHDVRQRGGVVDALKGKREYQERFEFALRDSTEGSPITRVECDSRDRDRGFSIGSLDIELSSGLSLDCLLYLDADSAAVSGKLALAARDDRVPAGTVERGDVRFEIGGERARGDDEDALPRTYLARREGVVVGMADRGYPGYIRVSPSLPHEERDFLAATLMALLIHRRLID